MTAAERWLPPRSGAHAAAGGRARAAYSAGRSRVVVLIPAHNEATVIGATIASLREQTRPPDRIIVVADNCTDATEGLGLLHVPKS